MTDLWHLIAGTGAVRFYGIFIGLVATLLTAKILGPAGQGALAASMAWVAVFAAIFGLSLGQVAQHSIQRLNSESWLPSLLPALLSYWGLLTISGWICAAGLYFLSDGAAFRGLPYPILALAFLSLPFLIWDDLSSNLLASARHLATYNWAQVVGRTLWPAGILVFVVQLEWGVSGALIAQALGLAIATVLTVKVLLRLTRGPSALDWGIVRMLGSGALRLHLNTIAAIVLAQGPILVLNHYSPKEEVGWYQLAFYLVTALLTIPQAASLVLYSRMAELGPDAVWPFQKRLLFQVMALQLLLAGLAALAGPVAIRYLLGEPYDPAGELLVWLLPAVIGLSFAQMMTPQWIGRGILLPSAICTVMAAVANMLANLVLVPKFGAMGAAWSSIIAYAILTVAVQFVFFLWCDRKYRAAKQAG